jgi:MoaA/NifB/PqqE/SkfB family radical SAM enzyme
MSYNGRPYVNVNKWAMIPTDLKMLAHAVKLMFGRPSRVARRQSGLTATDALFNLCKVILLDDVMRKRRQCVRFGELTILDSTVPPFPSKGLDRRLFNYLNNLDVTEIPSSIVSISTTHACPYSCAFCSVGARKDTSRDLDEALLMRIIDRLRALGVPSLILHGGEPFFQFDRFLRLMSHAGPDFCLWMFTTGWGATVERCAELKAAGLFGVWISLDHFDPKKHNAMRGNGEAFAQATAAVKAFKAAGVYTCLSMVPTDDLLEPEGFKRYYDFARELGVAEIRVMEKKPSGRESCRGVTPHSPVLARLQKELHEDRAFADHPPLSGLSTWLERDEALGCQCRFEYLFITADGEVQPCEVSEISFGNVKEEDFLAIYARIREAFPRPSTGCIPMVMFPEIFEYKRASMSMSSAQRAQLASEIMEGFRRRGALPGPFRFLWPYYERRLRAYRARRAEAPRNESSSKVIPSTCAPCQT